MTTYSVNDLAARVEGQVVGDGARRVDGVAGIRDAGEGDLSFIANRKYFSDAKESRAAAILVPEHYADATSAAQILVKNPDAAFAQLATLFAPPPLVYPPGIHSTAVVADTAQIDASAHVGPYCVVQAGAQVGPECVLVAFCYVGHDVHIGAATRLYSHVTLREGVRVGERSIFHNGAVIGSDGFGYTLHEDGTRTKVSQTGRVEIGDDVEIGANVTIDRARIGCTRIGNRVKIDNLVQVAHNVVIHDDVVLVSQVGVSGSVEIGAGAIMAGQSGVAGHLKIGERAVVGARGGVTKDVAPGAFVSDYPAMPHEKAARRHADVARLPQLKKKVADLEARLKKLEEA